MSSHGIHRSVVRLQKGNVSPLVSPQAVEIQAGGVPPNAARHLFFIPLRFIISFVKRTLRIPAFAICLTAVPVLVDAQSVHSDSTESFNPIDRTARDLWIQAQAPFSKDGAPAVVGDVVALGALLLLDQPVYDKIDPPALKGTSTEKFSLEVTKFGSTYGLGFLAGFVGYGFLANDEKAQETAYLAAEAFVTAGIWTQVLKFVSGRERPAFRSRAGGKWTGPFQVSFSQHFSGYDSFPSGHTSTAFSIATVFAEQYSETPAVPILSYSLAALVGLSRMTVNRHWTSDVFVGALIGYWCGQEVLANNPSEVSRSESAEIGWLLIPHQNDYGFSLAITF